MTAINTGFVKENVHSDMVSQKRIAAYCGIAGIMTLYGSILLAVVLPPSFHWTADAISDLGAVGADHAWIYNGGLILASFFYLVFAYGVFINSIYWMEYIGIVLIAFAYFLAVLAGIFPYPTPLHDPIALIQFFLIPIGLWVYGSGNFFAGYRRLGAVTIGLGVIAAGGVVWLLAVATTDSQAFALPELVVIIPFDTWAVITIWRLYQL
ncbi:DUF998 domain-containing protein [Halocatena marina]|uniref:DUF998 domain-containing protein n=1 Tax=Halocatena marina TaxID=2934937 RepID=A0ABD5YSD7_9EURY|nr:DUF998 domain-containing protein [Halocatena marina]